MFLYSPLNYPSAKQQMYMPLICVQSTQATLPLPDANVCCFPATGPSNEVPFDCTLVNLSFVSLAPLYNPHVPTSIQSSTQVQPAARPQTHVTSDLMRSNPLVHSRVPTQLLSLLSFLHCMELSLRRRCVEVAHGIPNNRLLL